MLAGENEVREHFNAVAQEGKEGSYEDRRWARNARVQEQRDAALAFLEKQVKGVVADKGLILELGPGPGTWTKILADYAPRASFVLTDIAAEMLERAKRAIPNRNVELREGDFVSVDLGKVNPDYFFSSRALEYVSDKQAAIKKISEALQPGADGCIITKMPKPLFNRLRGYTPSSLHQGQISPAALKKLLAEAGLESVRVHGVTYSMPFLKSASADKALRTLLGGLSGAVLVQPFLESYAVLFRKPL
jgi:trans-aconitate methyltransferase